MRRRPAGALSSLPWCKFKPAGTFYNVFPCRHKKRAWRQGPSLICRARVRCWSKHGALSPSRLHGTAIYAAVAATARCTSCILMPTVHRQHARGGDVFGHHTALAVDPANYPENRFLACMFSIAAVAVKRNTSEGDIVCRYGAVRSLFDCQLVY